MQLKTIPEDFVVVEKAHHDIKESGPYILIELSKRNLSTERALSLLADSLHLQRKAIGYAGTKDARALTRQHITIRGDENVVEKVKKIKSNQLSVRVLGFLNEPLGLGNLELSRPLVLRGTQAWGSRSKIPGRRRSSCRYLRRHR